MEIVLVLLGDRILHSLTVCYVTVQLLSSLVNQLFCWPD